MLMKIFVFLALIVAVGVGLGTKVLPPEYVHNINITVLRDFFDATLPVLAFAALVKYLCTCSVKCRVKNEKCEKCDEK